MKQTLIILLIVLGIILSMNYAFAQEEPIVGNWKFDMTEKIDYNAMVDTLIARGIHMDSVFQHRIYYFSLAAIIISRCESSEMFFSSFENQVMLTTYRYNDPTTYDTQWGRWVKISDGRYMVEFKNRIEFYRLDPTTGNFFFEKTPNSLSFVSAMLDKNLMLVKKGD